MNQQYSFWGKFSGARGLAIAMPRTAKQFLLISVDFASLFFAVWVAYGLRMGEMIVPPFWQFLLFAAAPVFAIPVFMANGLYRSVIRYVGEKALWTIVKCMFMATLLWASLVFFLDVQRFEAAPRSVPILYFMLGTLLVAATRFGARWLIWLPVRRSNSARQVLIFGANETGIQLANSLGQGKEMFPAGFIDDNPSLIHKDVSGFRVYPPERLPFLIDHYEIGDVIVCLPEAASARRREVVAMLEAYQLKVRILPPLADIASGKNLVNLVREVDVGDLLGRDPVASDPALLGKCIFNKVVLVSGAGGSIGSELCRQIALLGPRQLVLLEQSEPALYQVHRKLVLMGASDVVPVLGSVADLQVVSRLFQNHNIQTVYHAAAHKHVPLVESNIAEGIRNNIQGTQNLARHARLASVETFVLISTDKAVRPTNVMGATKRWAELVLQQEADQTKGTVFCAVRFGNVLGSSGSVIPLFREQIQSGGPITVTHPEVVRFFMSIHEAVELVIQAGSLAEGGEVFLLDMGDSVKIVDLAKNMIQLAGLQPLDPITGQGDIPISFTGLRPGEKLYEELLIDLDNARPTMHSKIMSAHESALPAEVFQNLLSELLGYVHNDQPERAKALLLKVACQ